MRNFNKYSLKQIILLIVFFSLIIQVSSEAVNNAKKTASKKAKVTPKKYRKNFVIRIPRTIYRPDGPKRITITRTTKPATIEYEIPTHTADETTTYYSTFAYDFISPSPQLSRVYKAKKSSLTSKVQKREPIPITKSP